MQHQQQCNAALAMPPAAGAAAGTAAAQSLPCAECIVRIQLTSGQTLDGGFYAHETLRDVYQFLHSSVVNADGEELLLRAPAAGKHIDFTPDRLDVTLQDAGLVPRAVSACSSSSSSNTLSDCCDCRWHIVSSGLSMPRSVRCLYIRSGRAYSVVSIRRASQCLVVCRRSNPCLCRTP
jgi:UBX domain